MYSLKIHGTKLGDNNFYTSAIMATCLMLNVVGIVLITRSELIGEDINLPKWCIAIAAVIWLLTNWMYFSYKGKYLKILAEFNIEKRRMENWNYLPGALYILLSFLFVVLPVLIN